MQGFEFRLRTRAIFGPGTLARLGEIARELGFRRALVVSDRGLVDAGHFEHACGFLRRAGISVAGFHDFALNPSTRDLEAGRAFAASQEADSIVGLGGGSSMDCAKGINFLLTNGGTMRDYRGYGKATKPMLPMIGVPTTTGTGSEAQSYALVSDAETHVKMACGDPQAAFRVAILDPELATTQPPAVRAATGYDAISHAVETWVTTKRSPASEVFSREAWRLLAANYERALERPGEVETNGAMMLGAFFAGAAIENSMLGATHACANPLTARYGTVHGVAIALLLAHVVRWNAPACAARYAELAAGSAADLPGRADVDSLAQRLERFAAAGALRTKLSEAGVPRADLPALAEDAAQQWTGQFNPRRFDAAGALEIYECAY
jgi:alcohol dehydrogenase